MLARRSEDTMDKRSERIDVTTKLFVLLGVVGYRSAFWALIMLAAGLVAYIFLCQLARYANALEARKTAQL